MNSKVPTHGGRRPGAGRPAVGTCQVTIRPLKVTARKLARIARAEAKTPGQVIDGLLERL